MSFERVTGGMHERRKSRNIGVALCLVFFIGLLFVLTTVKIRDLGAVEGFDHTPRATALPIEGGS